MFDYIARFVIILLGYCCAALAAGFFLAAILYSQIDVLAYALYDPFFQDIFADVRAAWEITGFYAIVLVAGPVLAIMAGIFSFFPALILIIIGEARGWRASLPYCIGGLVIGLLGIGSESVYALTDQQPAGGIALIAGAFACAGIVGGFIYWFIAGHGAGRLQHRPTS